MEWKKNARPTCSRDNVPSVLGGSRFLDLNAIDQNPEGSSIKSQDLNEIENSSNYISNNNNNNNNNISPTPIPKKNHDNFGTINEINDPRRQFRIGSSRISQSLVESQISENQSSQSELFYRKESPKISQKKINDNFTEEGISITQTNKEKISSEQFSKTEDNTEEQTNFNENLNLESKRESIDAINEMESQTESFENTSFRRENQSLKDNTNDIGFPTNSSSNVKKPVPEQPVSQKELANFTMRELIEKCDDMGLNCEFCESRRELIELIEEAELKKDFEEPEEIPTEFDQKTVQKVINLKDFETPKKALLSAKTDSALLYGLEGNVLHLQITIQFLPEQILSPVNMNLPKDYTVDQVKKTIWRNTPCLSKYNSELYYIGYNNRRENRLKIEFIRFTKSHPHISQEVESEGFIKIGIFPQNEDKLFIEAQKIFESSKSKIPIKIKPRLSIKGQTNSNLKTTTTHKSSPFGPKSNVQNYKNTKSSPLLPPKPKLPNLNPIPTLKNNILQENPLLNKKNFSSGNLDLLIRLPDPTHKSISEILGTDLKEFEQEEIVRMKEEEENRRKSRARRTFSILAAKPDTLLVECEAYLIHKYGVNFTNNSKMATARHVIDCELDNTYYAENFLNIEHTNWISKKGLLILSLSDKLINNMWKAVVWTPGGQEVLNIPVKNKNSILSTKPKPLYALKAFKPNLPYGDLLKMKEKSFCQTLTKLESSQKVHNYKFGVVLAKSGQIDELEMFGNEHATPNFLEFLNLIGDTVELKGWTKYRGGLDIKNNTTGTHSVYSTYEGRGIMFHVSTMLPFYPNDSQQLERKRHIGNDIVVIIFVDGNTPYSPDTIASEFNHVFIVVQKYQNKGQNLYKIGVGTKEGVPIFGPPLLPAISAKELKEWILLKCINAERAAYLAPVFSQKIIRTRTALMKEIASTYLNKN